MDKKCYLKIDEIEYEIRYEVEADNNIQTFKIWVNKESSFIVTSYLDAINSRVYQYERMYGLRQKIVDRVIENELGV